MPLTPEDVHNKQFTTVRLREGYDEEEVDAFLDEVEAELTRLIRENEELRAKLAAATRAAASAAAAPVPMRREPTPIPPPAPPQPALPAPLPAPLPVPQAPQFQAPGGDSAARVLALAQQTADQAIAEARNEANKIVGEARGRADGLEREARGKADALERDAQEKHRVAMGSLETARAALERKVDDLRAFEREYRAKLQAWLEGQFRELLEGVTGPGADETIKDLRKRASESPGQRTSAVLLREDGTYDVVQFGTSPDGPGQPRDEPGIQEAHRQAPHPPEGNSQAPDEGGTR